MSEVKRWTVTDAVMEDAVIHHEDPAGGYVLVSDYDALAAELAEAEELWAEDRRQFGECALERDALRENNADLASSADAFKELAESYRAALVELVACKDLHDEVNAEMQSCGDEMSRETKAKSNEYQRRKPLAWGAAREALRGTERGADQPAQSQVECPTSPNGKHRHTIFPDIKATCLYCGHDRFAEPPTAALVPDDSFDAARYRWLRDQRYLRRIMRQERWLPHDALGLLGESDRTDHAIDLARAAARAAVQTSEGRPYDLPHGAHDWHHGQCARCGTKQQSVPQEKT